jgi:hypothetical protein
MALASPQLRADEAQCRDVLNKCDAALNAELNLNTTLKQINDNQAQLITVLNTQLNESEIWKPIALGAGIAVVVETLILVLKK